MTNNNLLFNSIDDYEGITDDYASITMFCVGLILTIKKWLKRQLKK